MIKETNIELTKPQSVIFNDNSRKRIAITGRRFGKTYLILVMILVAAMRANANIAYVAPTFSMANKLMWLPLKRYIPRDWVRNKYETAPRVMYLKNGSVITLHGAKNYDNIRGDGITDAFIDEVQDTKEELYTEVLNPQLAQTQGNITMFGTPKGVYNWTYPYITKDEWSYHTYTSLDGGWIDPKEIEAARRELDERTFNQEYLARYETMSGLAYYAYSDANYSDIKFDKSRDTYLCFDFNVDPMTCAVNQKVSDGKYCFTKEFVMPRSNTEDTSKHIASWLQSQNFNGNLQVTGDNAGTYRSTTSRRTDWYIIEQIFKNYNGYAKRIRRTNSIRERVSALNAMFKSMSGEHMQYVNRAACPVLHNNLIMQTNKADGTLEDNGGKIGHITDGASYFAMNYFPLRKLPQIQIIG